MSTKREQSAIDAIYEILEQLKLLEKKIDQKFDVVDSNIKLLNNKLNKINQPITPTNINKISPEISNASTIKVFGKIKNRNQKPIQDVFVTILNVKGEMIKNRKTDSDGYWEARIFPGQYVIEYNAQHINKSFVPVNINIELDETMTEFEVKNGR